MNKQSKRMLSKASSKHKKVECNAARIISIALMVVIGISFWANLQMVSSPPRSIPSSSSSSLRALPKFTFPPYPKGFERTRKISERDEIIAWDKWAESPIVGSYRYNDKGATIHYPHIDLQSHYHDTKVGISMASSSKSSLFLKETTFPDNDSAVLTRKGNKFNASGVKSNQDRVVVLSFPNSHQDWWVGLFDGHGYFGHATSHYASLEFPKRLMLLLEEEEKVSLSSSSTIDNPEDAIKGIFKQVQNSMPLLPEAGSTAISIWKRQQKLYISNVGDSSAFVASYDKDTGNNVQILYATKPHKPDSPEERARIVAAGGEVIEAPFPGASARLLIPDLENPQNNMALAMSRSLGDHEGENYGLSSEPTTDVLDLTGYQFSNHNTKHYLVVAASDGLIDKVNAIAVAQAFAQSFVGMDHNNNNNNNNNNSQQLSPLETAEQLILKSSEMWREEMFGEDYRDDISVAAHRLRL